MKKSTVLRRFFALALSMAMLFTASVSCGKQPDPVDTTVATESTTLAPASVTETEAVTETQDPATADVLPEKNYENAPFTILLRTEWDYEFVVDTMTGDLISDAIYQRNTVVEERFGVDFQYVDVKGAWNDRTGFLTTVSNAVSAGDGSYDMIAGYQAYMITAAMAGNLYNINDMPHIDPSKAWWSEQCNDSLTVGDCLYLTTGDIALTMWENIYVYYFSKTLAAQNNLPDLYALVKQGEWTLDKVNELTADISQDVDGNGVMDESDLYGFVTTTNNHMRAYIVSGQTPIAKKDAEGYLELCYESERTQVLLDKLLALHHRPASYINYDVISGTAFSKTPTMFTENRALLMSGYLGTASTLRDMDTDFGILPYPKLDSDQENYYTSSHNSVSMICFLTTVRDPEMSGLIAEALGMESHKLVIPQYYELALKSKNVRDEQSAEMIDLIHSSLTFDFGWVHSVPLGEIGTLMEKLVKNNTPSFSSSYKSQKKALENFLKKVNDSYRKANAD